MTLPLWLGSFSGRDGDRAGNTPRGVPRAQVIRPETPEPADPDAAVVIALRHEDDRIAHTACETIFRAYYPILCEFAVRYVGSPDVAREVVAEVFVRLWNRRLVWELHGTLRSYLYGAVANAARNRRRDAERDHRRAERSVAGDDDPVWIGKREPASDALVAAADLRDRLWTVVESLGDDGFVLTLRWRHALEYDEIARVLGISAGAAQRRHSRAMVRLREALPALFREDE